MPPYATFLWCVLSGGLFPPWPVRHLQGEEPGMNLPVAIRAQENTLIHLRLNPVDIPRPVL